MLLDNIVNHYYIKAMSTSLDEEVRGLLCARRGDWQRVAEAADVSHSWISKFVNHRIPNPGYATLQKLHRALAEPVESQVGEVGNA